MSVKNSVIVRIGARDGSKIGNKTKMIDYSRYAVMPVKFANLLDERLDECYLSFRHMQRREFKPMTPVEITFKNIVHIGAERWGNYKETRHNEVTICYFVANDSAIQSPVGSGLWNHDLYLIEITKYLEMFVMDSLTFRNDLGKNYIKNAKPISAEDWSYNPPTAVYPYLYHSEVLPGLLSVVESRQETMLPSMSEVIWKAGDGVLPFKVEIYKNNTLNTIKKSGYREKIPLFLTDGSYTLIYKITGDSSDGPTIGSVTYNFTAASNLYPLKQLTCTDVINRLCDLAEPLVLGEKKRFILNKDQEKQFDKIYAPEFSMTKQTLRECLKEVGQVLHGEPRLRQVEKDNFDEFEIYYDLYGGTKEAHLRKYADIFSQAASQIEEYCSHIDSSAQNLINQTDWAAGVITEPSQAQFRTVRTETQYVRISDENMLIATDRPIYQVKKLEALINDGSNKGAVVDITPYVVESTIYNSQLSSYDRAYPYSKAYGLYFTQGEKNIKGLNFKPDRAMWSEFENYAIVNIIRQVTNNEDWKLDAEDYPELAFRVTYVPFFDVRIAQTKSYYKDHNKALALVYNQTANTIESRNYGENLKGVVARLGNPEVSVTYNLTRWTQIPKAGELYNKDYYISAVSVEYLPNIIKCTVGLSKDFNRISEYIGVSSEKRYYEIAEKQTYDRSTLYHEYIVVGKDETCDSELIGYEFMNAVADTFMQEGNYTPLTCVVAWGGTINVPELTNDGQTPLPCVQLPVVSTAFGNSMAFIWNYQDNYSAGAMSQYMEGENDVSGYWQNDVQYTDYYGRMYYYNFDVRKPEPRETDNSHGWQVVYGRELPYYDQPFTRSNYLSTKTPRLYRKDSAEIPQFNVQIEFVTNRRDLIIGSALASSCGLIRGSDSELKAKLILLDTPINKFTTRLSAAPEMINGKQGAEVTLYIKPNDNKATGFMLWSDNFTEDNLKADGVPFEGKSWVIITGEKEEEYQVEDETSLTHEPIIQKVIKGGEVLLACNGTFNVGGNIGEIYFTPKRKIFN